jgi:membrane protease YdiL (CAAX protease family)
VRNPRFSFFLFLFVLVFFVLPPVVFQFIFPSDDEIMASYPVQVFLNGGLSALLYFFSLRGNVFAEPVFSVRQPFFVYSSNALVCFGILCLSSVVLEAAAYFFKISGGIQNIVFPKSIFGGINFVFGVLCAAFFEEIVYRFYLPQAMKDIFVKGKYDTSRKSFWLSILCETAALVLFSLGHIYLGLFGFLNALVCGAALRVCMLRTKSVWVSFVVHSAYNFLSFSIIWGLSHS